MQQNKAKELLSKYQSGQCSDEEKNIVENWLVFGEPTKLNLTDHQIEKNVKIVADRLGITPIEKKWFSYKFAAAAAVIIIMGLSLFFYNSGRNVHVISSESIASKIDIKPGGNAATLILPDGKSINLKEATDQMLLQKEDFSIVNTNKGQLIYSTKNRVNLAKGVVATNNLRINTLITPRGGQYQVILPDGTKVWLNSASSLKFPAQFLGTERSVELTGEAYFEVAKNALKPFIVKVNSTEVKVLGTHFNVNAYGDVLSTKTTLLEGSIELSNGSVRKILKPNQQGNIGSDGSMKIIVIDTEQTIAWKNGYFSFKRTSLHEIMQQISRWYNVDVIYNGKISSEEDLAGKIKRASNLSKTLELLEFSGVHFKVKGHQVIVTPKQ